MTTQGVDQAVLYIICPFQDTIYTVAYKILFIVHCSASIIDNHLFITYCIYVCFVL